ncbi:MAG: hypothetical protein M1520_01795 [Candidatus Marsarchaeota archaeon]|nr:hypothetical protein [Candidatus Marsarchaeota archaeon]
MDKYTLCHVCGKPASHVCKLCGRHVCSVHFDEKMGVCTTCSHGRRIKSKS